jgi:hypothetical protein
MLGRVEEMIQQPGAPNLYWALTNLPRPLIDLRKATQGEKLMLEAEFPELRAIEKGPLSADAQRSLLKKLQGPEFWGILGKSPNSALEKRLGFVATAMKIYPQARRNLIAAGRKPEEVEALPVIQVIMLDSLRVYRRFQDDALKWMNVPYWQAREGRSKTNAELCEAMKRGEGMPLLLMLPAVQKIQEATIRTERWVAALRCIEAVRLYAATHKGKLPASLSDIKDVPIPLDPATGRPFEYSVKGNVVTLREAALPGGSPALPPSPLHYEITFAR